MPFLDFNSPKALDDLGSMEKRLVGLSTLIKINNIIGYLPLNLEEILDTVVKEVYKLFEPCTCSIHLTNEKGKMTLAVAYGLEGLEKNADYHQDDSASRCSALKDGLPLIIDDISEGVCSNRKKCSKVMSYVCIPIIAGKESLGTLSVDSQKKKAFNSNDLEVLLSIASQLSLSIQRSLLFKRLEEEKKDLKFANKEITALNRELEHMVRELKEAQHQLIRSEKLAATGRLAAGLAHEINNPTSIILNRIECLLMESEEKGFLPEEVLRDLNVISSYTKKISSIVKDLLVFSRSPSEKYRTVDLLMIIQRIVEVLAKKDKAYHFNLVWKDELPAIRGDEDRLEQVFLNLLDNAMYAMPEGGNIDIIIEKKPSNNEFMEVTIADKGKGIPESELSKIFDPFFTTKKIGKGTGLGLSICLSIIKEHNGDIVVESWPGKGSTFKVLLPLKDSKESKDRKSGDDYLYDKVYS